MKKMKLCMLIMCLAGLFLCMGCNESQVVQDRPVYGNGDLSPEYVAMFGDDNGARLNFIQEQEINKLRANVYGFSHTDKDGKVTTGAGLIERVKELEGLLVRIEKLDKTLKTIENAKIGGDAKIIVEYTDSNVSWYPLAIEGDE